MRSKVRIIFSANNSLREALHGSEVYLTGMGK
jgi:hypothetical protein